VPVCEPLLTAGAAGGNGIAVDEYGQTSLPHIYAIGDCALHANHFAAGSSVRIESVQNAADMAATVANAIAGQREVCRAVPWFWSTQYDLRLQTVGLSLHHDEVVVRGDMATRSFSLVYLRKGRIVALDSVNAARDFIQGRVLVRDNVAADYEALADTNVSLKESFAGVSPIV
jgi:3-phenylpropionate/trans-cinnamate dioxygenase ferredoxin reductase subunit